MGKGLKLYFWKKLVIRKRAPGDRHQQSQTHRKRKYSQTKGLFNFSVLQYYSLISYHLWHSLTSFLFLGEKIFSGVFHIDWCFINLPWYVGGRAKPKHIMTIYVIVQRVAYVLGVCHLSVLKLVFRESKGTFVQASGWRLRLWNPTQPAAKKRTRMQGESIITAKVTG